MHVISGCFGRQDDSAINKMLCSFEFAQSDRHQIFSSDNMVLGQKCSCPRNTTCKYPLISAKKTKGVILRGEIYNSVTTEKNLKKSNLLMIEDQFEFMLALYEQRGPDFVRELEGAYVFVLFDTNQDSLMIARDPIGIKSLYYGFSDGAIYFCSESRALTCANVDKIYEFPPGHYYTPQDGFIRYYSLPVVDKRPISDTKSVSLRIHKALKQSIGKRLQADPKMPLGVFCPGDLNSSIIAAIASQEVADLHTFTVDILDENGNESEKLMNARRVATHINSTHHEFVCSLDEYYEALKRIIHLLDTYNPFIVRRAVHDYFNCKIASKHVSVALSSIGANELFAGSSHTKHYTADNLNEEVRNCLKYLHNTKLLQEERVRESFNIDIRMPFLDKQMIALAMKIPANMKIKHQENGDKIRKWILRKAFAENVFLPDEIIWQRSMQEITEKNNDLFVHKFADKKIDDNEFTRLCHDHPQAGINSKETAFYFKLYQQIKSSS